MRVLVYGYGNPGRQDDGLGPALAAGLAARGVEDQVRIETGYQLQIEDAALVAEHDVVVFADADRTAGAPFALRRLEPRSTTAFTTHALAPETVLALARDHFGGRPRAFVLAIRGYEFADFGEGLSPGARHNLDAAVNYVDRALRDGELCGDAVAAREER
jgi:hydrogenase maturation protease